MIENLNESSDKLSLLMKMNQETLNKYWLYCQEHGLNSPYYTEDIGKYLDLCLNIEYTQLLRKHKEIIVSKLSNYSNVDQLPKTQPILKHNVYEYEDYFHHYALKNNPFVFQNVLHQKSVDLLHEWVKFCFISIEEEKCHRVSKDTKVPLPLVHNFLEHYPLSLISGFSPEIITRGSSDSSISCPNEAHMLLVQLSKNLNIRVFLKNESFLFKKVEPNTNSMIEVGNSFSGNINFSTFSIANSKLYPYSKYASSYELFNTVEGQVAFIPGSMFATWSNDDSTEQSVLKLCYVDASNFYKFIATLRESSLTDDTDRKLLQFIQSNKFGISIERRPIVESFIWELNSGRMRVTNQDKKSDIFPEKVANHDTTTLSRRERFKIWQDDRRWSKLTDSMTLPVSMPPIVTSIGRTNVTVKWQDIYKPRKDDITLFGYELLMFEIANDSISIQVEARKIPYDQLSRSVLPTVSFGRIFDGKELSYTVTNLSPNTSYSFAIRVFIGDEIQGSASDQTQIIHTIPITEPSMVPGIPNDIEVSSNFVLLRWKKPLDNGGVEITHYKISHRILEGVLENNHEKDQVHGNTETDVFSKDKTIDRVPNLFPNTKYMFRVAGCNRIGCGNFSVWTKIVKTTKWSSDHEVGHISGIGHIEFDSTTAFMLHDSLNSASRSLPFGLLSDKSQILQIRAQILGEYSHMPETFTTEVWSCHYSPKVFNVSSEIVLANPTDASTPLVNAADVRHRMVFVERGNVPFRTKVLHAQQAGALGVVIGDINGDCKESFDQHCIRGADKSRGEGFGIRDHPDVWKNLRIPSVLLLQKDAKVLKYLVELGSTNAVNPVRINTF